MLEDITIFIVRDIIFFVMAAAAIVAAFAPKWKKAGLFKLGVLSAGLAFALSRLASLIYYNPRPFVVNGTEPLIPHGPGNGFPSDHALLAFTLAGILYSYNKTVGLIFYAVGITIGVSRVLIDIHSPVDILGSFVISVLATIVGHWLLQKYSRTKAL